MVRAGNDNELIDDFLENGRVAIGWGAVGDLSGCDDREEIQKQYRQVFEKRKDGGVQTDTAQLNMLVNRVDSGDRVLTYDKGAREYHIGTVTGNYFYESEEGPDGYPHLRSVKWMDQTLARDDFSTSAQNTLGGALTVFSLNEVSNEINALLEGESPAEDPETGEEEPPYIEEVQSTAEELISDIVADIDPFDLEELVAAVLRAMGYKAKTTQAGGDYGVDVVAHPDALGFEEPRIKVQVKHTKSSVGNEDIGRFLGTLNHGEKGLYVSTGGYTRPAQTEARAHGLHVTLLDRDDFIELLLEHYEGLESEFQSLVPLKPVYLPTSER